MTCDITTVPSSANSTTSDMMTNVLQTKADLCATSDALAGTGGGGYVRKSKRLKKTSRKQRKTKKKKEKLRKTKKKKKEKQRKKTITSNPNLKSGKNIAKINKILKSFERNKKKQKDSLTSAVQYPIMSIF